MMATFIPLVIAILVLLYLNKTRKFGRVNCSLSGWIGLFFIEAALLWFFVLVIAMFHGLGVVWLVANQLWAGIGIIVLARLTKTEPPIAFGHTFFGSLAGVVIWYGGVIIILELAGPLAKV